MICFRDRTFCSFYRDCESSTTCGRAFTPDVEEEAERWWGGGDAPVCFFIDRPKCYIRDSEAIVPLEEEESKGWN